MKEIDLFKSLLPTLRTLSSGILERDHWREFWATLRSSTNYTEGLRLETILSFGRSILENLRKIQDIASRAQGEAILAEALKELAVWWETAEF
jgi:hypothetical protein